jgi:hypothetical protein
LGVLIGVVTGSAQQAEATTYDYLLSNVPFSQAGLSFPNNALTDSIRFNFEKFQMPGSGPGGVDIPLEQRVRMIYDDGGTPGNGTVGDSGLADDVIRIAGLTYGGGEGLPEGQWLVEMEYTHISLASADGKTLRAAGGYGVSCVPSPANSNPCGVGRITYVDNPNISFQMLGQGGNSLIFNPFQSSNSQLSSFLFKGDAWLTMNYAGQTWQGDFHFYSSSAPSTDIPEPSTLLLLGTGALFGGARRMRRGKD